MRAAAMTTPMHTVILNDVREKQEHAAEEISTAKRGFKEKVLAAVKYIFCENENEKIDDSDLSQIMKTRVYMKWALCSNYTSSAAS